jgi:hypothetical protein
MTALRTVAAALVTIAVFVTMPASSARAAGTTVSGTVSGSDQGFLTGASVVIEGPQSRTARTDADGRFTFADVQRGRYKITASADGYLPIDRPMEVGDASVSVDIVLLRLPGL